MDIEKDKEHKSVLACSPLTMFNGSLSPSPSTTTNSNNKYELTSNRLSSSTPNGTPNPIPTLPNNSSSSQTNVIPRIPFPEINHLSLPPLPNEFESSNPSKSKKRKRSIKNLQILNQSHSNPTIKIEENPFQRRTRSMTKSPTVSSSMSSSPSYSVNAMAFNHNLKVKQEHLRDEVVTDCSFDSCFIFHMKCPYKECNQVFDNMTAYQNHHTQKHQDRDKNGKLLQTKEAKWKCPECGKVSASWYNYAAHVTMHKESCDAPWICKLPPINKKKYIQWTDGSYICGKRCSTKHNLIKHLKALHPSYRIIDLSQSVKAQNKKTKSKSPRKYKKRPRFIHNSERPKKRIKMDPNANFLSFPIANGSALPIYSTGTNSMVSAPNKSVKSQSDFVGLLLEAAQLIEKDQTSQSPPIRSSNMATNISNAAELFSSIKNIFNANSETLSQPVSIKDVNDLSAVLALKSSKFANFLNFDTMQNNEPKKLNTNGQKQRISIENITNLCCVPSENENTNGLNDLLKILNKTNDQSMKPMATTTNICVNNNTFNTYNTLPMPLFPNFIDLSGSNMNNGISLPPLLNHNNESVSVDKNEKNESMESVISNNILPQLPPLIIGEAALSKSS